MDRPPLVDPIGRFPPRLVYAAILALELLVLGLVVVALLWGLDRGEDALFPGGTEWLPF